MIFAFFTEFILTAKRYQTFTHPVADKLRTSVTPPASPTPNPRARLSLSASPTPFNNIDSTPIQPSLTVTPPQNALPSPQPQHQPPSLSPTPFTSSPNFAQSPAIQTPFTHPPSPLPSSSPFVFTPSAPPPSLPTFPSTNSMPPLSSSRIHEIIAQQEARFRDMHQILNSASIEIEKALETNTSISRQLSSVDELLAREGSVLHNILEQEKEKLALFAR